MNLIERQEQIVIRDEEVIDRFNVPSNCVIYIGLGHVVLDSNKLKTKYNDLFNEIIDYYHYSEFPKGKDDEDNGYYFRLSFFENPSENEDLFHHYFTMDLEPYKPKTNKKLNIKYYMGIRFYVIEFEKVGVSKNIKNVNKYRCDIKKIYIDEKGNLIEENIWKKIKYGYIENFLPKELKKFEKPVKKARQHYEYINYKKSKNNK